MSYNEFLSYEGLKKLWEIIKSTFVAKEEGKGLSSKDFTLEYINKIEYPETVGTFPESSDLINIENNNDTYIRAKDILPELLNKVDKTVAFGLETDGICAHSIFNGWVSTNAGVSVVVGEYVPLFLIESLNLGKAQLFFTLYSRDAVDTTYTASYYFSSRSGEKYELLLNDFTSTNNTFIKKDSVGFIKISDSVYLIVRKVLNSSEDPFVVSINAKEVWDQYANITCFTSFETEKEHPTSPGTKIVFHESISEYTYSGVVYNISDNYIPCIDPNYIIGSSSSAGLVKSGGDVTILSDGTMLVVDDSHNHIISNIDGLQSVLDNKVTIVSGKGLSTNDYTTTEKNKLASIASGAEVNVLSDWNVTDSSADAFIKNKPSIPTVGNGIITINQAGVKKGSFELNQEGNLTIDLSDNNTTYSNATSTTSGLMSNSDKSKLDGIASGAEVNQNAFSNVKVGTTTISSDLKTDTLTFEAGSNITLAADSTNDKITITAKDTTYSIASSSSNGLMSSSDKTKLDTIASNSEKNTIVGILKNGTLLTPNSDRVVNITVPIKTSELTNDSTYLTSSDVASTITELSLNTSTGVITATRKNGTTFTIDLPTEKIIKSGYYDSEETEIVLVLEDDSEIRFSASELIDSYYGDDSTIELYTDTNDSNKKKFRLTTSYKNKVDGSEQTSNRVTTVNSSSVNTKYPTALAVWNAIKNFATNTQTFTLASTRSNIETGETISTVFGKIKKWFADLKTVAFTGSYNDLSDKPTIGSGEVIIKQAGTLKGSFKLNDTTGVTIELTDNNTTYNTATSSANGLMSSSDKSKLDGIATGAEVNVLSDWSTTDSTLDSFIKNKPTIPTVNNATVTIKQAGVSKGSFTLNQSSGATIELTDNNTTYSEASTSASGLMSATDKVKLDGITTSADSVSFSRSLTSGTKVGTITINGTGTDLYAPSNTNSTTGITAGATGTTTNAAVSNPYIKIKDDSTHRSQILLKGSGATTVSSDANGVITIKSTDNNTTYSTMTGATSSAAGTEGLVPAPASGKQSSFLRGDGTWVVPTNTTYSAAGTSLGLVKSGGDITVASDGTVSVNDNSHNHSASNITSGTLAVARGGTGQTSTVNASNAFINALTEGTSTPVDNDYMITQSVNGGTTTTTYHRRKMSVVWEYFKSKISSVLGLTANSYGGTAKYLYSITKSRNNNKIYQLLGTYPIEDSAYWDRSFSLYVQGRHNTNLTRTYLVNVGMYTNENKNISVCLTYPISSPNTYLPILGEVYNRTLYIYVRNIISTYEVYTISILNDNSNGFKFETNNLYYDSSTPNGGTSAKILHPYLEITDSNLSEYYDSTTEILKNIHDVAKVIAFRTTNIIIVSAIQFASIYEIEPGRRLTLVGNYAPSEHYANTTTDGRFSQYLYEHRGGERGYNDTLKPAEFYEDFIYFNGIWFGKGY